MANNGVVVELSNDDNKRRDQVLHHYRGNIDDNLTPLYQSWAEKYEKVRTFTFSKKKPHKYRSHKGSFLPS